MTRDDIKKGQKVKVALTEYIDCKFVPPMEGTVNEIRDDSFLLYEVESGHLYEYRFAQTTLLS